MRDEQTGHLITTSFENFQISRMKYPNEPYLGTRPMRPDGTAMDYEWLSYEQVGKRVDSFGAGLVSLGLCPTTDDVELKGKGILGFYSKNRAEWCIAEQGCYSQSIIPVPSYDTLGADSIAYVVNQTSMVTMLCSAELTDNMIACKALCPTLLNLIQMEPVSDVVRSKAQSVGVKVYSFDEVEAEGRAKPLPPSPPTPKDIATFCYTSGTTGDPKGALLSHENMVSDVAAIYTKMGMSKDDVHLSYLPLPHVFERAVQMSVVRAGGRMGFYQGETLKILEDLTALRPTLFPSVPRLLNRIHDKLLAGVVEAGGLKKTLFDKAFAAKKEGLKRGVVTHGLWDRLIFSKIKDKVGLNRVKLIVTGSAPIASHVLDFLRIVFCCPVLEGYGMTESTAAATLTWATDCEAGTVGPPVVINDIRLQDVPDMGYLSTDTSHGEGDAKMACCGRGEICFRGPNVFNGYYKLPDKTAEAIDKDNWLHSGDIGLWTTDGRLKIIDRKKNIFKLQQGEYVAPEKIENILAQSGFIAQNMVYGDSLQRDLVLIATVDPDAAAAWGGKNGISGDVAAIAADPKFKAEVMADIKAIGKKAKLVGFEFPKDVYLDPVVWEPGGFALTPTFKLQRKKAQEHYQSHIDEMYARVNSTQSKL
jgi:long-chain acyl-CoA synthetase